MGTGQPLRVLIVGQRDNFGRVLATNIQRWGYEVVTVAAMTGVCSEEDKTPGDILLCDLDELLNPVVIGDEKSAVYHEVPAAEFLKISGAQYLQNRLMIVFSSRSVSRTMLEQMGAVALLQKPFQIGRLQRYLQVLQRLIQSQSSEEDSLSQEVSESQIDHNMRVLVVDDDEDVAYAIAQCLMYEPGYEVVVAHDGLDALERCADWHPQCVVTDLIMPRMNGYQVMRCLALTSLRRMPAFVIMSALTHREVPVNLLQKMSRAVIYVDKPFNIEHLLATIKQVCTQ